MPIFLLSLLRMKSVFLIYLYIFLLTFKRDFQISKQNFYENVSRKLLAYTWGEYYR